VSGDGILDKSGFEKKLKTKAQWLSFFPKYTTMKGVMTTHNLYLFRNKKKAIYLLFTTFYLLPVASYLSLIISIPPPVFADEITNGNYSLDVGTIDTNPQPTTKPPQQVLGSQSPKPEFTTGPNYTVITPQDSFAIKLSQNLIDYGLLSSTNPVIRTSEISVINPHFGSEVLTYENQPLQSSKKDTIQNTTCDNGECSPTIAALWTNTLTFGFVYRCDSNDVTACDPQFSTSNYFKQYPQDSLNQPFEPVITSNEHVSHTDATITYKVNISGTQKVAGYYNSITYLAVPNF